MSDADRDYNLRQLRLMRRSIEQYLDGSIRLGQLVNGLETLNAALQNPSEAWLSEFEPAWGALEDTYAAMLAEERKQLDEHDKRVIESAIGRLNSLLRAEIDEE